MIKLLDLINQGDPRIASILLGDGPRTFGSSGCLIACLVMARNILTAGPPIGATAAVALVKRNEGFKRAVDGRRTASLDTPRACAALGIKEVERVASLASLGSHLAEGKPAIVGIDYKPGRSSGFTDADHFLLALGLTNDTLTVADPNGGRLTDLDLEEPRYAGKPAKLTEARYLEAAPT